MGDVAEASKALVERAGEIYAGRNPCAPGERPIEGEDLSSEQLKSVTMEVFQELDTMNQTLIQHEMRVETSLEKRAAKDARISTGGESHCRFCRCGMVVDIVYHLTHIGTQCIFSTTASTCGTSHSEF